MGRFLKPFKILAVPDLPDIKRSTLNSNFEYFEKKLGDDIASQFLSTHLDY